MLGPDGFEQPIEVVRIAPALTRKAPRRRVADCSDSSAGRFSAFPEVGFYRQQEEMLDYGSNPGLLRQISSLTGGHFEPAPLTYFAQAAAICPLPGAFGRRCLVWLRSYACGAGCSQMARNFSAQRQVNHRFEMESLRKQVHHGHPADGVPFHQDLQISRQGCRIATDYRETRCADPQQFSAASRPIPARGGSTTMRSGAELTFFRYSPASALTTDTDSPKPATFHSKSRQAAAPRSTASTCRNRSVSGTVNNPTPAYKSKAVCPFAFTTVSSTSCSTRKRFT